MTNITDLLQQQWKQNEIMGKIEQQKKKWTTTVRITLFSFIGAIIFAAIFQSVPVLLFAIVPLVFCFRTRKSYQQTQNSVNELSKLEKQFNQDMTEMFVGTPDTNKGNVRSQQNHVRRSSK